METHSPENKENDVSVDGGKKNHRRDSLGRGILKNLNRSEDNHTLPIMQLPLRDSQNVPSAKLGKASYRRRVSFAPEVTLHKIEMIPKGSLGEQRQPKRRETIAFAPSSGHASDDRENLPGEINNGFEADGLMYDSSDIEMEDDSHVYSSPNRMNSASFKIHSDNNEEDSVNMSITQAYDESDDNNTMDLTKPLGSIQQVLAQGSGITGIPDQDSIIQRTPEKSTRPFGSITSIFGSEISGDDGDQEQEMELTQPFSKVSVNEEKDSEAHFGNEVGQTSEPLEEETMDLTSLAECTTDMITLHNTKFNRETNVSEHGTTQGLNEQEHQLKEGDIPEEAMISMEETALVSAFSQARETPRSSKESSAPTKARGNITPLKPSRSHTSENGSPMSSKRKGKRDEAAATDLRDRINSLTPRKKRKSMSRSTEHSQDNSIGPVFPFTSTQLSSQVSSQEEIKSSFTPLRSSKGIRKSIIGSDVIKFGSEVIETAPLAAPQDGVDVPTSDMFTPVSLKQFLNDLSIEFFDNLDINDDLTVTLNDNFDSSEVNNAEYLIARASQIPWLELYIFSCTELQKNMAELKKLFDNLNEEFSEENPPLVREYYQTTSMAQQKKMSDHLLFMKTLSDKEAESSWLTWRLQLLEELDTRLTLNHESLKEDSLKLQNVFEEIYSIEQTINTEYADIMEQFDEVSKQSEIIEASEEENVLDLRKELLDVLETALSQDELLKKIESQSNELQQSVLPSGDLEKQVSEKRAFVEINTKDPHSRLTLLYQSFIHIQSISGVKFKRLAGKTLITSLCDGLIELAVDLSKFEDPSSRVFTFSNELPDLTKTYVQRFINNSQEYSFQEQLTKICNIVRSLNWLHDELYYIGLVCPTKITFGESLNIEIKEYNRSEGYKATISINITQESLFGTLQPEEVTIEMIYGPKGINNDDILNNFKLKALGNSWVQGFNVMKLIN